MLLTCTLAFSLTVGAPAVDDQPDVTQPAVESPQNVEQPIDAVALDEAQSDSRASGAHNAEAQKPPTPPHTGIQALFSNLIEDVKHLPARQNLYLAAIGGGLAAAVHPADQTFNI